MATSSGGSLESSFQFSAVSPSDTEILKYTNSLGVVEEKRCKAIYVGSGGNLAVADDAGNSVVFVGVVTGSLLPISTEKILSTGTTATSIVACF